MALTSHSTECVCDAIIFNESIPFYLEILTFSMLLLFVVLWSLAPYVFTLFSVCRASLTPATKEEKEKGKRETIIKLC